MIAQKQLISYWSNKFKISDRVFESKNTSFYSRSHLNEYQKIIVFRTRLSSLQNLADGKNLSQ